MISANVESAGEPVQASQPSSSSADIAPPGASAPAGSDRRTDAIAAMLERANNPTIGRDAASEFVNYVNDLIDPSVEFRTQAVLISIAQVAMVLLQRDHQAIGTGVDPLRSLREGIRKTVKMFQRRSSQRGCMEKTLYRSMG